MSPLDFIFVGPWPAKVSATAVEEDDRPGFFLRHFRHRAIEIERTVYAMMRSLCAHYSAGHWEYFALDNGGCYLAPPPGKYVLVCPNGVTTVASADVAGLIASLYAMHKVAWECFAEDALALKFYQAKQYATVHDQAASLLAALGAAVATD